MEENRASDPGVSEAQAGGALAVVGGGHDDRFEGGRVRQAGLAFAQGGQETGVGVSSDTAQDLPVGGVERFERSTNLRRHRRDSGLTAMDVARATGTSESNIASYARGDKVPGSRTLQPILDAIDAGPGSPIYVHGLITTPQAAAAIGAMACDCWLRGLA